MSYAPVSITSSACMPSVTNAESTTPAPNGIDSSPHASTGPPINSSPSLHAITTSSMESFSAKVACPTHISSLPSYAATSRDGTVISSGMRHTQATPSATTLAGMTPAMTEFDTSAPCAYPRKTTNATSKTAPAYATLQSPAAYRKTSRSSPNTSTSFDS